MGNVWRLLASTLEMVVLLASNEWKVRDAVAFHNAQISPLLTPTRKN